jgi:hypothetical protein
LKQCRFKAIEINAAEWYPPAWWDVSWKTACTSYFIPITFCM